MSTQYTVAQALVQEEEEQVPRGGHGGPPPHQSMAGWPPPPSLTLSPPLVSRQNTDMNNGHADWSELCCCMVVQCPVVQIVGRWSAVFMEYQL